MAVYTPFQLANMQGSPYAANPSAGGVYQSIAAQLTPSSVIVTPNQRENQRQRSQLTPIPEANPMQLALAKQMMATGSSTAPVRSPLEGLARTLTGVAGGYFAGEANRAEKAREGARGERLATVLGLDPEVAEGLTSDEMVAAAQLQGKAPAETWSPMSAKAATARGLPEGVYQVSSKGKIQPISKGGVNVNVNTGETYDEESAKQAAKFDQGYRDQLRSSANDARKKARGLNRLEELITSGAYETGALTPIKTSLGQFATAMGLDPKEYGLGDIASAEEGRALQNRMVMDSLSAFAGALSEKELTFAEQASSRPTLTPEANLSLIDLARTAAQRQVEQYSMLRRWTRVYGSPSAVNQDGQDFEDMWDAYLEAQGEGFEPPEIPVAEEPLAVGGNGDFGSMSRNDLEAVPMSEIETWPRDRQNEYARALDAAQRKERPGT